MAGAIRIEAHLSEPFMLGRKIFILLRKEQSRCTARKHLSILAWSRKL
jgi:hypothetical protein